jgi:general secretion pathway protein C
VNFPQHALLDMTKLRLVLPRPELGQRLAVTVVTITLVIALARGLAILTLAVLFGQSSPSIGLAPPAPDTATAGRAASVPSADDAAIAGWHLFGRAESGRPVKAPPVVVPVTPLNLRLVGVFFAERGGNRALALIAEGSGIERGYRIGEALPGGVRLEQILRDRVIVSRNGQQEAINMPKMDESGQTLLPTTAPAPLETLGEPEPDPAVSDAPQIIDASAIAGRLRGEIAARPQALEDIAFASPYMQNGQFVGFRLRPGRDRQIFQQLGLNGGDVLTEINGTRINSPAQGLMMLQELMSASQLGVRVLRNGAEIPLTFSLDGPFPK